MVTRPTETQIDAAMKIPYALTSANNQCDSHPDSQQGGH